MSNHSSDKENFDNSREHEEVVIEDNGEIPNLLQFLGQDD